MPHLLQSKVAISGYGVFYFNGSHGLVVDSNGAVLTANLTANQNAGIGVAINTIGLTGPQSVTLTGRNSLYSNGSSGLTVDADGNITVNNISAIANGGGGARLDNFVNWSSRPDPNFATFGSVTVSGYGFFTDNVTSDGLSILTHGNVTLTRIWSDSNGNSGGDAGIEVFADGNVTIVCSSAIDNLGAGLQVGEAGGDASPETLTLKGFVALANATDETIGLTFTVVRTNCP